MACGQQIKEKEEMYRQFFEETDTDKSGTITISELRMRLIALAKDTDERLTDADCADIITDLDKDGNNIVTLDEYLNAMLKTSRKEAFTQVFKKLDTQNTGKLSKDQVGQFCAETSGVVSDEILQEMFQTVDTDGDGNISLDEFLALV